MANTMTTATAIGFALLGIGIAYMIQSGHGVDESIQLPLLHFLGQ
jgi:hypothetical protein